MSVHCTMSNYLSNLHNKTAILCQFLYTLFLTPPPLNNVFFLEILYCTFLQVTKQIFMHNVSKITTSLYYSLVQCTLYTSEVHSLQCTTVLICKYVYIVKVSLCSSIHTSLQICTTMNLNLTPACIVQCTPFHSVKQCTLWPPIPVHYTVYSVHPSRVYISVL